LVLVRLDLNEEVRSMQIRRLVQSRVFGVVLRSRRVVEAFAPCAVAFCLLLPIVAGCSSRGGDAASGAKKIVFWHTQTDDNAKALNELVRKYNATNRLGVVVEAQYQGNYDDIFRKTMAAVQGGKLPDIAVAYESMVAEYMRAGVVRSLDDFVKGPNGLKPEDLQDIEPAFLATNRFPQFGNKLLSFPFTKSVLVMYSNLDALKAAGFPGPPRTWDEFWRAALAVTKPGSGGSPGTRGFIISPNASTIDGWFYSNGGKLLTPDRKRVLFNEKPCVEIFEGIRKLVDAGAAYMTAEREYQMEFGAGRGVMFCGSSTQRNYFREAVAGKFRWAISNIPQKDPKHPVTVLYGANLAIFRSTPEREAAAWDFVKWLSMKEQTAFWAIRSSYMPIRKSVARMPEMQEAWKRDPQGKQAFEVIKYAVPEPNVRGWQDVRTYLEEALQAVVTGTDTPQSALDKAAEKANKALASKA